MLLADPSFAATADEQTWTSTSQDQRIIGGEKVKTCGFPSVVTTGMCSATLVHPKLFFTAAHCLARGGPRSIRFGEGGGSTRKAKVQRCKAHPSWKKTKEIGGTDIAYCILEEEVNDVPLTPILMGCEIEVLQPGTPVVIAGFGRTTPPWSDQDQATQPMQSRGKHWVETSYVRTNTSGELDAAVVGKKGKQGCSGDSGGPVFVKLPEDKFGKHAGWRVFGVTSGQADDGPNCQGGEGTYAMMHEWIETVEQESGLDLTPCFDADGTWNPGPHCHSAPKELDTTASGSWPDKCESGPLTGKITTCGEQPGEDESESGDGGSDAEDGDKSKDKGDGKDDGDKPEEGDDGDKPEEGDDGDKPEEGDDGDEPEEGEGDKDDGDGDDKDADEKPDDGLPSLDCNTHRSPGPKGSMLSLLALLSLGWMRRRT